MVSDVESLYDVQIDAVIVGDRELDDRSVAVAGALRESCVNAAKHSGDASISVYVECRSDSVDAYVRDRGSGFDLAAVGDDRQGIATSITARVQRVGGTVHIETAAGFGTEVQLHVPVGSDHETTVP
jgi:signal transduction histidine kinase